MENVRSEEERGSKRKLCKWSGRDTTRRLTLILPFLPLLPSGRPSLISTSSSRTREFPRRNGRHLSIPRLSLVSLDRFFSSPFAFASLVVLKFFFSKKERERNLKNLNNRNENVSSIFFVLKKSGIVWDQYSEWSFEDFSKENKSDSNRIASIQTRIQIKFVRTNRFYKRFNK